jgi:hypothetical protein
MRVSDAQLRELALLGYEGAASKDPQAQAEAVGLIRAELAKDARSAAQPPVRTRPSSDRGRTRLTLPQKHMATRPASGGSFWGWSRPRDSLHVHELRTAGSMISTLMGHQCRIRARSDRAHTEGAGAESRSNSVMVSSPRLHAGAASTDEQARAENGHDLRERPLSRHV